MKVKSSLLAIGESSQIVHMDEAIQRRGKKHVQVLVILNLGDPAPMGMDLGRYVTVLIALVLGRALVFGELTLLLSLSLLRILLVLLFFRLVPILGSGHASASSGALGCCRSCSSAWVILIVFILVGSA